MIWRRIVYSHGSYFTLNNTIALGTIVAIFCMIANPIGLVFDVIRFLFWHTSEIGLSYRSGYSRLVTWWNRNKTTLIKHRPTETAEYSTARYRSQSNKTFNTAIKAGCEKTLQMKSSFIHMLTLLLDPVLLVFKIDGNGWMHYLLFVMFWWQVD